MRYSSMITIFVIIIIFAINGGGVVGKCYEDVCVISEKKFSPEKKIHLRLVLKSLKKQNIKIEQPDVIKSNRSQATNNEVFLKNRQLHKTQNLCKTKVVCIKPNISRYNKQDFIVQDAYFQQSITFEVCANTTKYCNKHYLLNTPFSCKQLYMHIRLLIFDTKNEQLRLKLYKVPNTCVCTYDKFHQKKV